MKDGVYHCVLGVHGLDVGPAQSQGFAEKLHVVSAVGSCWERDDVDSRSDSEGVRIVFGLVLLGGCGCGSRGPYGGVEVEAEVSEGWGSEDGLRDEKEGKEDEKE